MWECTNSQKVSETKGNNSLWESLSVGTVSRKSLPFFTLVKCQEHSSSGKKRGIECFRKRNGGTQNKDSKTVRV